MTLIVEEFLSQLFQGKGSVENHPDFIKHFNGKFEVFVFDNRVLVMDKRRHTTVIYNNIHIAKAKLINTKG